MTAVPVKIREATERDLPGLAALLGERDGLAGPYPGTRRALLELDPARIRVWIAAQGERVVAVSCAELRRLQIADQVIDAGYWTNLFVHPDYRDQLLYPRLPQAMLRGLAKSGITRVYLAIRRLEIANAHLRIGFRELARYVVRIKPLRPLSLASKQFGLPAFAVQLAAPLDRAAGLLLRVPGWRPRQPPRGSSVVTLSLPEDAEAIAALLMGTRAGLVTRWWDSPTLCARYQPAADDAPYVLLGLAQAGVIIGVAAYRFATRETGVRVGVVMELAARDDDPQTLALLLRTIERRARDEAADAVLLLDSLGPAVSRLARMAGYLDSGERYVLMAAPKRKIASEDPICHADEWRFPLSDHDAF